MFVFVKNDNHVLVSSILFVLNEFQFLTLTNNIWPNSIHNVLNAPHHHNVIPTQPGNTQLINIICHSAVHHQTPLALLAPAPYGSASVLVRPLGQHCEANNSRPLVKDRLTDASVICRPLSALLLWLAGFSMVCSHLFQHRRGRRMMGGLWVGALVGDGAGWHLNIYTIRTNADDVATPFPFAALTLSTC